MIIIFILFSSLERYRSAVEPALARFLRHRFVVVRYRRTFDVYSLTIASAMEQRAETVNVPPERLYHSATPFGSEIWLKTPTPAPKSAPETTPQRTGTTQSTPASQSYHHEFSLDPIPSVELYNDSEAPNRSKKAKGTKSVSLN